MRTRIAAALAAAALVLVPATASAHPVNPPGNDKDLRNGGPVGTSAPGDGARGHFLGIDCHAALNPTPIGWLDVCVDPRP